MHFTPGYLVASLIWGSIAGGFLIYGKKQSSAPALFGGLALVGVCYFIESPLWMSLAAILIIAGIYLWAKRS